MNVLLVDDDRFVVAALKKGINWTSLGFENVYMAYGMEEAKSIMLKSRINLLLSDIDMPHGSGLDLLEWVQSRYTDIPCIFLTNYADFDYAQQAVSLHCFHYFLKPIDYEKLSEIIQKAVLQINERNSYKSEKYISFWANTIISGNLDTFRCPYSSDSMLLPIWIQFFPHFLKSDNSLEYYTKDISLAYLQSTFEAFIPDALNEGSLLVEDIQDSFRFFGVIALSSNAAENDLLSLLEEMQHTLFQQLHCPLNIYMGNITNIAGILNTIDLLRNMIRNDLSDASHVSSVSTFKMPSDDFEPANVDLIYNYLENESFENLTSYCHNYLQDLSNKNMLSAKALGSFQVDIIQALYTYLRKKGILAKKLYLGEPYHTISSWALSRSTDMELYLQYIFRIAESNLNVSASEKSVAEIIRDYVDTHYSEDIGRQSLESILYFDPDYASRLFKKETGQSFMNYVIQKRISEAQKLLKNTDMPISQISVAVGYDNYSYFTRLFKKETGLTPIEYRIQD